ncbi:MAG: pitrilysin family protein [Burkholderiaceae bacterium]|nr:pitrilysin family protein [Burkholderiaceae bacterium]
MHSPAPPPDPVLATLANGVRVIALPLPHLHTAAVSVFVRTGSAHESAALNGISHVIEHMAFKGTAERDVRRINLDAERLGAEVNAHTDKDHTAYQMRGLAGHASDFVRMLGDIVLHSTFPAAELERERQVLLQEFAEDDDDPVSTGYKLFDRACYGLHAVAQPVIGSRRNIERFQRDDLVRYVARQYSGANLIVGAAGAIDAEAIVRAAEAAFGAMPQGTPNLVAAPSYAGAVRARALAGSSQTHVVLGFPIPSLRDDDAAHLVAAAVFGEGMSSPLLARVREQRALAYHASCSADRFDMCGQLVIEASTAPEQFEEFLREVTGLLLAQARAIDPVDLERARNQIAVRRLHDAEKPLRRLEEAALEVFVRGHLRAPGQALERLHAVGRAQVQQAFERMLDAGPSAAIVGSVRRGTGERARAILATAR